MPEISEVKLFYGTDNFYVEIAQRGNETMGISLTYQLGMGVSCIVPRFVVHSPGNLGKFTELKPRKERDYKREGVIVKGMNFHFSPIPVFKPSLHQFAFLKLCNKFHIWEVLADWVKERCVKEGFTVLDPENLPEILRGIVDKSILPVDDEKISLILDFPFMGAPAQIEEAKDDSKEDEEDEEDEEE